MSDRRTTALAYAVGLATVFLASCGDDSALPAETEGSTGTTTSGAPPLGECRAAMLPGARQHCLGDDGTTGPPLPPAGTSSSGDMETTASIPDLPDNPPLPSEFDCNDIPDGSLSYQLINGPRGYHGLAISPDGLAIGSDGSSLVQSTYDGMVNVFIPGIGSGQQMDWLTDGDLAHATDDGAITRLRLDGTTEVIRAGVDAYGVTLGPDEQLYVASNFGPNAISRIEPETGDIEVLFTGVSDSPHSLGFSPDGQRLYIGVVGAGTVFYVDLDEQMNPTTEMLVLSNQVGRGWHDAIAVDICGYLYVPDYWTSNIYRIAPNGDTTIFWVPPSDSNYSHGLIWGTGENGWRQDALYFPQPYNNNMVGEVVVGVPPRDWDGTVLNAPMPL